ncbi:MAG: AraC family transcriptional regulator [Firmicutes bacterium]|nr:AraC family transcriptional regulator [Bacillota bacterium]
MDKYKHFENLSVTAGLGITILDVSGQILFESSVHAIGADFLNTLYAKLDCAESCRIAFLYGCYQSRRFGGRYIFFAPSGLVYCAAPLLDGKGKMLAGVLAGPFILTDHDDYINFDMRDHALLSAEDIDLLREGVYSVPCISPKQAHAVGEHLYYVVSTFSLQTELLEAVPVQTDMFSSTYSIEKEDELLLAISKGDIHTANVVLGDILRQMLLHNGSNIEVLRSRVVELTVLLSRAALKGGADINAILGLNYGYLREIDSFSCVEDIVLWLHMVTRRFTEHVFEFSGAKHMDIIYKAIDYIKRNYAAKLTLRKIAGHLFISQQYFCRIFKEETGQTPVGYITFVRIEESKKLLRDSSINIVDIPERVGFKSQSYFTKIFKKETGITPGQYRRENIGRV